MDHEISPHAFLQSKSAESVSLVGDKLEWTTPAGSDHINLNEILFILGSAPFKSSETKFLICALKETAENKEQPYQLLVLNTAQIPHDQLASLIMPDFPAHLRHGDGQEVSVIVSTKSGTGLAPKFWEAVLQPLWQLVQVHYSPDILSGLTANKLEERTRSYGYDLLITQSASTVREFALQLKTPRTVVLLSGDGGVVDLLNGLNAVPEPPLIALIPLGTANALFSSTHKPLDTPSGPSPLVLSLRTLFRGTPAPLPVFRASFSPGSRIVTFTSDTPAPQDESAFAKHEASVTHLDGAIVASYGFHATLVADSDTPFYRTHGAARFQMVAAALLKDAHPYIATLSLRRPGSPTWEPVPRNTHAYILAALVSNLERTFAISPATQPLDHRLRVVHFGDVGGERTMDVMMKAYDAGKHVGMRWDDGQAVGYEEVEEVRVVMGEEDERWRRVCVDGTIVALPRGGEMCVRMREGVVVRMLVDGSVAAGVSP